MELDSIFPALRFTEPIDIFPLKNYFLVAFPNFIAFGSTEFSNFSLSFSENSYIKIQHYF